MSINSYRILSLDGGGSWALLQVMALQDLYGRDARGHAVLKEFDLVAANSGGSIALGGLLTDRTLNEILEFFLDETSRRKMFSPLPFEIDTVGKPFRTIWNRMMRRTAGVGARYRTIDKFRGLSELLQPISEKTLHEIQSEIAGKQGHCPHLLVCGFDYDQRRAKFFRSNVTSATSSAHASEERPDKAKPLARDNSAATRYATLAQAVHASSTAPVQYFMSPAEFNDTRYWDGAIAGYNNPVMAAVTEAFANRANTEADRIDVLSIGTGTISLPSGKPSDAVDACLLREGKRVPTLFGDLSQLAEAIIDDPPESATFVAHVILGQPLNDARHPTPVAGSVVRISPLVRPVRSAEDGRWCLPAGMSADDFEGLVHLELDAVEKRDVDRLVKLGELWIKDKVGNQAIRENQHFECQIGFPVFSQAREHWRRLSADRAAVAS